MTLLRDIANELAGMFLADARLSGAILTLVLSAAGLVATFRAEPLIGGAVLLIGCNVILVEAAFREDRRRRRSCSHTPRPADTGPRTSPGSGPPLGNPGVDRTASSKRTA